MIVIETVKKLDTVDMCNFSTQKMSEVLVFCEIIISLHYRYNESYMEKKLYHGSKKVIETPSFGSGNPHNDYGLGFYCTENIELAKEWACSETEAGFVNAYDLNLDGLSVCNLSNGYHILNWLAILLENRTFDLSSPTASLV